jgi:hypothetical protein
MIFNKFAKRPSHKSLSSLLGGFAMIRNPFSAGSSNRQTSDRVGQRPADETVEGGVEWWT